jgi:hypothetical protein
VGQYFLQSIRERAVKEALAARGGGGAATPVTRDRLE